jgi:hypothetical protein
VLSPSGNILMLPDVTAGHPIVFGFKPSHVTFLQLPAAKTASERKLNQVNISVKAINIRKYRYFIIRISLSLKD